MRDYRNMVRVLNRGFGDRKIETITSAEIETWIAAMPARTERGRSTWSASAGSSSARRGSMACRATRSRWWSAPGFGVPRRSTCCAPRRSTRWFERAEAEQDAALFHAAAFAGLRMGEILALRWRDIDFRRRTIHVRENWTLGETTTPKGGAERAVPMADEVARRLARLGRRKRFTGDDDLVFCTERGEHLGYKSLKDRYRARPQAAGLREDFRFHNLRHTFGSTVIRTPTPAR